MHNPQTRNQFIALRAQGWSLAHIAVQIHVHQRTLVVWNREMKEEIHHHRALEVEALQEKLLASHELELSRLASTLEAVEQELKKRDFAYASTTTLVHLAAKLRDQIRKIRIEPNFDLYPDPAPDSPEPTDPGSPFFTLHSALPDNTTKTPPELHHSPACDGGASACPAELQRSGVPASRPSDFAGVSQTASAKDQGAPSGNSVHPVNSVKKSVNTTITPPKPHQILDSFSYRLLDHPFTKPNRALSSVRSLR
jgi:hypothetical protein